MIVDKSVVATMCDEAAGLADRGQPTNTPRTRGAWSRGRDADSVVLESWSMSSGRVSSVTCCATWVIGSGSEDPGPIRRPTWFLAP